MAEFLTSVFASVLLAGGSDGKLSKDLERIQGTWKLIEYVVEGEDEEFPANLPRWVIKGNKVVYGGETLANLTVDGATTPPSMDLEFPGSKRVLEGVWSIEGDTLKICANCLPDGVKERPVDFVTKGKSGLRLLVLKREKPGADDGTKDGPGFVGMQINFDKVTEKITVVDALKNSPAMKAGLKKDDVILQVGTTPVTDLKSTVDAVRQFRPATDLTLRVARDGKELDIRIRVGVLPFFLLD